jgi:SAM-dependent methyltransferase
MDLGADILAHYALGVERDRLTTWGRLEAARTWELLRRFLPEAPAAVLDVGGAEGAYALPLARGGYRVRLVDPVPQHVDAARAHSAAQPNAPLAGADVGDARDLSMIADHSVDAVVMLGPLYHLTALEDRARALAEARRVLRSRGVLLAAAISRFASALDGLRTQAIHNPTFEAIVEADLENGVVSKPEVESRPEWFTLAYFHRPEDLRREVAQAVLVDIEVLPVEGPVLVEDESIFADPDRRAAVLRTIERLESEPSLLGASQHLMAIAAAP